MKNAEGSRARYIDNAKGKLIILMVYAHVFQSGFIHDVIYTFHMGAFFIISGILFNYTKTHEKPFLTVFKSKLYSFGIPFLFFEVYACLSFCLRYGFTQNIKGFIYNTITLNFNNGVNWFIFTLFFSEILFIVVIKYCKKKHIVSLIGLLAFVISVSIPVTRLSAFISRPLLGLCLMIIGYYSRTFIESKENTLYIALSSVILLLVAIYGKPIGGLAGMDFGNPLKALIGILSGTYLVLQISIIKQLSIIEYLGKNSIIIYGTHNTLYIIFGKLFGIDNFETTVFYKGIATIIVVMIIECIFIEVINRFLPFLAGKKVRRS